MSTRERKRQRVKMKVKIRPFKKTIRGQKINLCTDCFDECGGGCNRTVT